MDKTQTENSVALIDKAWLQARFAEQDRLENFTPDTDVTVEQVRAMMLADGIKPEDNVFSREIICQRYSEE